MRATVAATFASLIALLYGCDKVEHHNNVTGKQLSSEQAACILRTEKEWLAQTDKFTKRYADAMLKQQSTIELIISERRMNEDMCLREAKCYSNNELIVSTMFDSCLNDTNKQ